MAPPLSNTFFERPRETFLQKSFSESSLASDEISSRHFLFAKLFLSCLPTRKKKRDDRFCQSVIPHTDFILSGIVLCCSKTRNTIGSALYGRTFFVRVLTFRIAHDRMIMQHKTEYNYKQYSKTSFLPVGVSSPCYIVCQVAVLCCSKTRNTIGSALFGAHFFSRRESHGKKAEPRADRTESSI